MLDPPNYPVWEDVPTERATAGVIHWEQESTLWVHCPAKPLPFHVWPPNPWHPFLRPLRRAVQKGNPAIGHVRYLLLDPGNGLPTLAPMAIVESRGKPPWARSSSLLKRKLVVFPAWGDGIVRTPTKAGRPHSLADHITFDETKPGRIAGHITPHPGGLEEKPYRAARLQTDNSESHELATLSISTPQKIDAADVARWRFRRPDGIPWSKVESTIEDAVEHAGHPVLSLLPTQHWSKDCCLSLFIILSSLPLAETEYTTPPARLGASFPRALFGDGDNTVIGQFIDLKLDGDNHLLIASALQPGKPSHDFQLGLRKHSR